MMRPIPFPDDTVPVRIYRIAVGVAVLVAVLTAVAGGLTREAAFATASNDDVMRLMSVRDWLAGQSWFDTTQYRIVPPDGLSLHWSRYVDLGIGAVLAGLSLVFSQSVAEHVLAVLWPLLLLLVLVAIVGDGTRRLLGNGAAAVAVVTIVAYPPLAAGYFGNGRFDHHNVQIILMTLAALSLALRDAPVWLGVVAGAAAALSLATGLETLFMVAAISVLHVTDAAFGRTGARGRLAAYCLSLLGLSLLAFAGQTPVADWAVRHCDELAVPILALVAVGAASGLMALAVPFAKRGPVPFLVVVAAVTGLGLLLAWPVIGPCLQAPYANLSEETRLFISEQIAEALPLAAYAAAFPAGFVYNFGPAITVLTIGTLLWVMSLRSGVRHHGVGHLLLIGWLGLFASFWQMRQVVILASVTPVLAGYVVAPALLRRIDAPSPRAQLTLYAVIAATVGQPVLARGIEAAAAGMAQPAGAAEGTIVVQQDADCIGLAALAQLNAVSPGVILSSMNLGPKLIMTTHHAGLAAPYHRSAAALESGFTLQRAGAAEVQAAMAEYGADMVLVCAGSVYGTPESVGSRLAQGAAVEGFDRVEGIPEPLMLYSLGSGA